MNSNRIQIESNPNRIESESRIESNRIRITNRITNRIESNRIRIESYRIESNPNRIISNRIESESNPNQITNRSNLIRSNSNRSNSIRDSIESNSNLLQFDSIRFVRNTRLVILLIGFRNLKNVVITYLSFFMSFLAVPIQNHTSNHEDYLMQMNSTCIAKLLLHMLHYHEC